MSRKLRFLDDLSALDETGENLALWRSILVRQTEKLRCGPGFHQKPTPTPTRTASKLPAGQYLAFDGFSGLHFQASESRRS
ncbi:hypothetical protein [Burkholderia lata]|uniref:hypothetical protein n=1 Tax=Burkholderia lata (strain ATCC 17760 / DSM 23089 / LMG 22485 / NCIMB 9086 / R18194 / 383) TaxID=482957 RepID=UPI0020C71687|nr:hypothetical protein [Burkholderia lata]